MGQVLFHNFMSLVHLYVAALILLGLGLGVIMNCCYWSGEKKMLCMWLYLLWSSHIWFWHTICICMKLECSKFTCHGQQAQICDVRLLVQKNIRNFHDPLEYVKLLQWLGLYIGAGSDPNLVPTTQWTDWGN